MPDAQGFTRAWLRSKIRVTTLVPADQIRLSVPEVDHPKVPMIVLSRQGGGDTYFDLSPRMIFEVWNVNQHETNLVASEIVCELCRVFAVAPFEYEGWTLNSGGEPITIPLPTVKGRKRVQVETIMSIQKGE